MTADIVRFGVLGAGRIGRIHATNVATAIEGAELVAIADVQPEPLAQLAARLRCPYTFADYRELLARDDLDAVVVCTPTATHYAVIMDAIAAGKQIFTEKPIDLELEKIDDINAEVQRRGVSFMVGFQRRYDPDFRRLHDLVRSGAVGDVHVVRLTSRDAIPPPESFIPTSGGLFLDMTIHDLDMAQFLVGSPVTGVYARAAVLVDPMFARAGDFDTAVITLTFANGAMAAIDNSRQTTYGYDQRAEVFGSAGMVAAGNHALDRHTYFNESGGHSARLLSFFPERYAEAYRLEMQAFVDALRERRPMPVTGDDGRRAVVVAQAALRSARENRFVEVDAGSQAPASADRTTL